MTGAVGAAASPVGECGSVWIGLSSSGSSEFRPGMGGIALVTKPVEVARDWVEFLAYDGDGQLTDPVRILFDNGQPGGLGGNGGPGAGIGSGGNGGQGGQGGSGGGVTRYVNQDVPPDGWVKAVPGNDGTNGSPGVARGRWKIPVHVRDSAGNLSLFESLGDAVNGIVANPAAYGSTITVIGSVTEELNANPPVERDIADIGKPKPFDIPEWAQMPDLEGMEAKGAEKTAKMVDEVEKQMKKLRDDAMQAVYRWVVSPDEVNTKLAFDIGNECTDQPAGLLALAASWSFGDMNPEGKTTVPTPPGLAANGVSQVLLKAALAKGGTRKTPERFQLYAGLGVEVSQGRHNWAESVEDRVAPHIQAVRKPVDLDGKDGEPTTFEFDA